MKFIDVNGIKTAYYRAGKGTQEVLFLHGWGSSGRLWLRSMWTLRHQYKTYAVDLPGFGDSDAPPFDWYTVQNYTDHIAAFCETLNIRPYAVVGHSLGGRIMFDLALKYPELAEHLIGVAPAVTGRLGFNLDLFLVRGVGQTMMGLSRRVWSVGMAGAMSHYWAPRYLGSEAVKRTTEDLQRSRWRAVVGSLQTMVGEDFSHNLSQIDKPTLLICGKRDITIPPDDSRLASVLLPDARLVVLDHVHHQPTDEAPDRYLAELQDFLTERQPVPVI